MWRQQATKSSETQKCLSHIFHKGTVEYTECPTYGVLDHRAGFHI